MASWDSYGYSHERRYDNDPTIPHTRHESRSAGYDYEYSGPFSLPSDILPSFRPEFRTYDPRYSYPLHPPQDPRRPQQRSPARHSSRWPPQPSVEEERDALLKESGPSTRKNTDDVSSRGTVDQEPIIIEVKQPGASDDLRFVWLASDQEGTGKGKGSNFTPPSSDDEKANRGRRKAPKLETVGLPEMARTSSPYSYTKPTVLSNNRSSGEFFLSPDSFTPPSTASSLPLRRPPTSAPTNFNVDNHRHPSGPTPNDSSPIDSLPTARLPTKTGDVFDEHDHESHESANLRTQRRPARYSFTRQEAPSMPRTSTQPNVQHQPALVQRPHLTEDFRRYTDSSTGSPHPPLTETARKLAPPKVANLVQAATASMSYPSPGQGHSRHSSGRDSATHSPQTSSQYPPSPPRSPRANHDKSRESREFTPSSKAASILASREGSHDTSPHGSPQTPNPLPSTDSGWTSAFASNAARRSHPSSRLASSTLPDQSPKPATVLPYPVDDNVPQLMPEERDHQFFPEQSSFLEAPTGPPRPLSRSATPKGKATTASKSRPSLPLRHSLAEGLPTSSESPRTSRHASSSTTATRNAAARTTAIANSGPLPPCPRRDYMSGYDDWYTLDDCPGFDICPDCLETVFANTIHRVYFRRAPRRAPSAQVKCDFGDPWMRLAWLLTLQRQQPTLNLLKALTNQILTNEQPCPDQKEGIRNWYTIRDESGRYIRNFTVCAYDVRRIELLLPAVRGLFVPLPIRTSYSYSTDDIKRTCALRTTNNNRFAVYLDSLILVHEIATSSHRPIDPTPFITLVQDKLSLRECNRDDMLSRGTWHFIPTLPSLTVCPDCYHDVIEPAAYADADIAMRFNHTPCLVPHEGRLGMSCQLYSQRMRRVWAHALETNDLKYLTRKAKERKEVEEALQDRVSEVRRKAKRLRQSEGLLTMGARELEEAEARLQRELDETVEEWSLWE